MTPLKNATILITLLFFFSLGGSVTFAQVIPETKYISTSYGVVERDFYISVGLSGQIREDSGIGVVMGMVPSKGAFSDIYTYLQFQYHLLPRSRFVPHLMGGAGAVTVVGLGRREVDFVISAGGGIIAFLTQNLALRLDMENYSVYLEEETDNRQVASGGVVLIF
jgi:hypothetical protein